MSITAEEEKIYRDYFKGWAGQSGYLNLEVYTKMYLDAYKNSKFSRDDLEKEAKKGFRDANKAKNGKLSFNEYIDAVKKSRKLQKEYERQLEEQKKAKSKHSSSSRSHK